MTWHLKWCLIVIRQPYFRPTVEKGPYIHIYCIASRGAGIEDAMELSPCFRSLVVTCSTNPSNPSPLPSFSTVYKKIEYLAQWNGSLYNKVTNTSRASLFSHDPVLVDVEEGRDGSVLFKFLPQEKTMESDHGCRFLNPEVIEGNPTDFTRHVEDQALSSNMFSQCSWKMNNFDQVTLPLEHSSYWEDQCSTSTSASIRSFDLHFLHNQPRFLDVRRSSTNLSTVDNGITELSTSSSIGTDHCVLTRKKSCRTNSSKHGLSSKKHHKDFKAPMSAPWKSNTKAARPTRERKRPFQLYDLFITNPVTLHSGTVDTKIVRRQCAELADALNYIARGIAGGGLAIFLRTIPRMLKFGLTFEGIRIPSLICGAGLVWLSLALLNISTLILALARDCNMSKESIQRFRIKLKFLSIRALTATAVAVIFTL